ncbi:MAG: glycosyltransferase family 2 protein [Solirubrobacterales bacterium]
MPGGEGNGPRLPVEISVVVPVYGCADCLRSLHERLHRALEGLTGEFELIFVDDRSGDGAWGVLRELAAADPRVRALRLSRNFGQHAAITAGLAESAGRWVVVMDCDLQDPPEEIPRLYAKAREGYDVVLSRRAERVQSLPRRLAAQAYFRVHNLVTKGDLHTNYTNLSIVGRKVVDSFLALGDRDRQYLLILHWLGFNRTEIEVRQAERHVGRSSYTFTQLLNVAVDGLFFQSTVLLRWIVYLGFGLAALGVALAAYAVIVAAFGRDLPEWTALPMLILVLTGFIIISTGVTGLYVGKIFDQVKGRPLYVVDSRVAEGAEQPREGPAVAPPPQVGAGPDRGP